MAISLEKGKKVSLKKGSQGTAALDGELSFGEILKQKQSVDESSALKFSKHASMRLQSRNIELSTEQKERLETGAEKAEAKGMKESLVIVDSYSFIVNVPNKTVVTAMDHTESGENVYTNIDGAVII
jgi:flagellar operon protein